MSLTCKRRRSLPPQAAPSAASIADLRMSLLYRTRPDAGPVAWCALAEAVGIHSAESVLTHLGRTISHALQSVSVTTEVSRDLLRSTREALLYAVNLRCDELEAQVSSAECIKIAALERELVVVDTALERWRTERDKLASAGCVLGRRRACNTVPRVS